jgi:pseudouridine-5'-phosphate glycosidase
MGNKLLELSPPVSAALGAGCPVVALESAVLCHGLPYPRSVETALAMEQVIWQSGCVPATVAVWKGRMKVGLSQAELEYLGKAGAGVVKAIRRDLPVLAAKGLDGAATAAAAMLIAGMAGIEVLAVGGIDGVHRAAETAMDVSADLEELAGTPVLVVSAGVQSVLDLRLTLEYLETRGVPVLGYRTGELPAFFTRQSGIPLDYRADTPAELAAVFRAQRELGIRGGMLVCNPIPEEYAMSPRVIGAAVDRAAAEGSAKGIPGRELTPFLLSRVRDLTGGESLESNVQLLLGNARLAAQTAFELKKAQRPPL